MTWDIEATESVFYLMKEYFLEPTSSRYLNLMASDKGREKLLSNLCHLEDAFKPSRVRKVDANVGVDFIREKYGNPLLTLLSRRVGAAVMSFEEARDLCRVCTFLIDAKKRFAFYVGDSTGYWILE